MERGTARKHSAKTNMQQINQKLVGEKIVI
jgi:hypothetical protein